MFENVRVTPSLMFDAPWNATCPPLRTAKGDWKRRERRMKVEISRGEEGLKMQWGFASCWRADQNELITAKYVDSFRVSTFSSLKMRVRVVHWGLSEPVN